LEEENRLLREALNSTQERNFSPLAARAVSASSSSLQGIIGT
jgi:cell shape-determining protein MreC